MKSVKTILALCAMMTPLLLTGCGSSWPKDLSLTEFKKMSTKSMSELPTLKVDLGEPINADDMKGKSALELSLLAESIPAQHGFRFRKVYLRRYFSSRSWYRAKNFSKKNLSGVDKSNYELLLKLTRQADPSGSNVKSTVQTLDDPEDKTVRLFFDQHSEYLHFCDNGRVLFEKDVYAGENHIIRKLGTWDFKEGSVNIHYTRRRGYKGLGKALDPKAKIKKFKKYKPFLKKVDKKESIQWSEIVSGTISKQVSITEVSKKCKI